MNYTKAIASGVFFDKSINNIKAKAK